MKYLTTAALAAAALLGASAHAQALISSATMEDMKSLVTGKGATILSVHVDGDYHYVHAKTESGLVFDLYGYQCDSKEADQRCTGLQMLVAFDLGSTDNVAEGLDLVDYAAVADFGDGESLKLSRYIILDGGVTRSNLDTNLDVFLSISNKVWDLLSDEELFEE
jgi:hypothetical protein